MRQPEVGGASQCLAPMASLCLAVIREGPFPRGRIKVEKVFTLLLYTFIIFVVVYLCYERSLSLKYKDRKNNGSLCLMKISLELSR